MRRYLLDTGVLTAYLKGRSGAVMLVDPWVLASEAATSIVVYGEIVEYLQGLGDPDYARHLGLLHGLLQWQIYPFPLTYAILERYAGLRRALRSPNGPGLIGDIDTLIAATALEYGLEIVTTDGDYTAFPISPSRSFPASPSDSANLASDHKCVRPLPARRIRE